MPLELTPTNFDFFARYVLAGFLIIVVRNVFVRGERPKIAEMALDILLLSLVNQAIWRIGTYSLSLMCFFVRPSTCHALAPGHEFSLYIEVLALPGLVGCLIGVILQRGWGSGVARLLSFPLIDPIPRAYDHVFANRSPGLVILTFQAGTVIYGYYGPSSRAGRDPARSEIYLERIYTIDNESQWKELDPPRGALISLEGIRAIEFLEQRDMDDGTQAFD